MRHFLSGYLPNPGVLTAGSYRHDSAVAVWREDGGELQLLKYWEIERLSGRKHHNWGLYTNEDLCALLDSFLREIGLRLDDVEAIWGLPTLASNADLYAPIAGTGLPAHTLAHLCSCMMLDHDIFDQSTILAMALDQGPDTDMEELPEKYYFGGAVSKNGELDVFPIESPGPLWWAARHEFEAEEGTLMALASAATTSVDLTTPELTKPGSMFGAGSTEWARTAIKGAHEQVRELVSSQQEVSDYDERFSFSENVCSATMKLVQKASQEIVSRNVTAACARASIAPDEAYLALAGGFALNCPTNSFLMERYGFRGLLAPPCPNDSGQALGFGLAGAFITAGGKMPKFRFPGPYLGDDDHALEPALEEYGSFVSSITSWTTDRVVDDILQGPIAWVQGAAEIGPRALGHRSLLADPRRQGSKTRLNEMKRRQWWRPVAPIVLDPEGADWFEGFRSSPYMLEVFWLKTHRAKLVPAIPHLDGTARIQSLRQEDEPLLHGLLVEFFERTGVPMLCNTSLNDKAEPIVNDATQALNFCIRRGVPTAYIGEHRIELAVPDEDAQNVPREPGPRRLTEKFDAVWTDIWDDWLRLGLSEPELFVYLHLPHVRRNIDVSSEFGREVLRRKAEAAIKLYPNLRAGLEEWSVAFGPSAVRRTESRAFPPQ